MQMLWHFHLHHGKYLPWLVLKCKSFLFHTDFNPKWNFQRLPNCSSPFTQTATLCSISSEYCLFTAWLALCLLVWRHMRHIRLQIKDARLQNVWGSMTFTGGMKKYSAWLGENGLLIQYLPLWKSWREEEGTNRKERRGRNENKTHTERERQQHPTETVALEVNNIDSKTGEEGTPSPLLDWNMNHQRQHAQLNMRLLDTRTQSLPLVNGK